MTTCLNGLMDRLCLTHTHTRCFPLTQPLSVPLSPSLSPSRRIVMAAMWVHLAGSVLWEFMLLWQCLIFFGILSSLGISLSGDLWTTQRDCTGFVCVNWNFIKCWIVQWLSEIRLSSRYTEGFPHTEIRSCSVSGDDGVPLLIEKWPMINWDRTAHRHRCEIDCPEGVRNDEKMSEFHVNASNRV